MAGVKELKKKIKSTKGTFKITSAMKLVAAAKMARAQAAIQGARPYANELEVTIKTVSALASQYSHRFLEEQSQNKRALVLVISSDKGLCGGFNNNLAKILRKFILEKSDYNLKFVFIGKKVRELLASEVNSGKTFEFQRIEPSLNEIHQVAQELSTLFETGEIGKIFIAYNVFHSAMNIEPTVKTLLPMTLPQAEKEKLKEDFPFDFKYEPDAKSILDTLIPEVYVSSVYTKILDSLAAEHASRMTAMESASKNSSEMIKSLTLKMNKLRQAAITTELIEVISGAESLNG